MTFRAVKALEEMSLEELWQLFPIVLTPHNPQWTLQAEKEINFLRSLLTVNTKITHIGSTAVADIWAKPIIDLLIEAENANDYQTLIRDMLDAGYRIMNHTTEYRSSYNKGYTPEGYADKVFHAHLRLKDDNDEVFFRDFLNSHKDVAKEYERLKLSLWKMYEHDRDAYTREKSEFVNRYTTLAKEKQGCATQK